VEILGINLSAMARTCKQDLTMAMKIWNKIAKDRKSKTYLYFLPSTFHLLPFTFHLPLHDYQTHPQHRYHLVTYQDHQDNDRYYQRKKILSKDRDVQWGIIFQSHRCDHCHNYSNFLRDLIFCSLSA